MKFNAFMLLVFCSSGIYAQGLELMKDQVGRPILSPKMVISGNPYLSQDWLSGVVYLKDGKKKLTYSDFNFNILENRIEFRNTNKVFFVEPSLFNEVDLFLKIDTLKFKKGFTQANLSPDKFYQVLFSGKHVWLKQHLKSIVNDPSASYASQATKVIQDEIRIYMIVNNEATLIKMNKRYLKNTFKGNDRVISLIENTDLPFEEKNSELMFLKALDQQL